MHPIFRQFALGLWSILPGNYSAIAPLSDSTYVVVDDKSDVGGFSILTLDFNTRTGRVKHASMTETPYALSQREKGHFSKRDGEGICYCPWRNSVFISGEEDQQILEYNLDGSPTGSRLAVPEEFGRSRIVPNRGFEALACDTLRHLLWTTTEAPLPADTAEFGQSLRLIGFGEDLQPRVMLRYPLDTPRSLGRPGTTVYGVPSLLVAEDGRLLVMERELYLSPGKISSWCTIRIYTIDPDDTAATKTLLVTLTTRPALAGHDMANFEGMCWGPVLRRPSPSTLQSTHPTTSRPDRKTLLLIADSQAGYGNRLYHLRDYLGVIVF